MVSKRVVHSRASRGYIPSKNKLNDRARRVNEIFEDECKRILGGSIPVELEVLNKDG